MHRIAATGEAVIERRTVIGALRHPRTRAGTDAPSRLVDSHTDGLVDRNNLIPLAGRPIIGRVSP